ncbi:acylphosphatase [Periweissella beninensis]|uniref:acylphosphatase n=1 Tax=Periweissella beninensis TaxID=504936 RepID=A0ABT0VJS1_9LACO|nr:acylphosphatase [Periweissella beninensis]MBM7544080.1 acylphosphatase [Periweissella beninensis]MCM2437363.1 acylphosphatase [Periweissella beninensis]MCT4396985.1 acylphosphatase [Periweissella beninensis]
MLKSGTKIQVWGRVQGVGFRWATKKLADKIGVFGYVTNLPDGSVSIIALGDAKQIGRLINGLKENVAKPLARVQKIEVTECICEQKMTKFVII